MLRHRRGAREARARDAKAVDFYRRLLPGARMIFDVGANIGTRVAVFRRLGAHVVAVEPQPSCVDELERRFAHDRLVTLVPRALGAAVGTGRLRLANRSGASSMSSLFIGRTSTSGRFGGDVTWGEEVSVEVTTLDILIAEYGLPTFCKIDVEGLERDVLGGVTHVIPAMSFEFTPELSEVYIDCIDTLSALSPTYEFNYSLGETFLMEATQWLPSRQIKEHLLALTGTLVYGDVYARVSAK